MTIRPVPLLLTFVMVVMNILLHPTLCNSVPLPPELTLDIPESQVRGIWTLTRLSHLLGPTPALVLYRKFSELIELYRPIVLNDLASRSRNLCAFRRKLLRSATNLPGKSLQILPAAKRGSQRLLDKERSRLQKRMLGISTVSSEVYHRILHDPRLSRQRMKDSKFVLGDAPGLDIHSIYEGYKSAFDSTVSVMNDHIARANLSESDAKIVHSLVVASLED